MEIFELFGGSAIGVFLIMSLLSIPAIAYRNTGVVDLGWGLCFLWVGLACGYFGEGAAFKRLVLTAMVAAWSGRLAWHLWLRFDISQEDPRYTKIMKGLGENLYGFKIYLMFLLQGGLVLILSLPFYLAAGYAPAGWHALEVLAVGVYALGLWGEYSADKELASFKNKPANKGKVCNAGLWNYTRHPNYFFEWVIWIAFFLFAIPSPFGWAAVVSPVIMFVLLTKVSGIPPAEEQALKSKGDA